MHKLGDQWIEVIGGQEHMVKAVEGDSCQGCVYASCSRYDASFECMRGFLNCPFTTSDLVLKDLGILKDGILPSPFIDNKYPRVTTFPVSYCWLTEISDGIVCVKGTGENAEESYRQAIEAWHRRA